MSAFRWIWAYTKGEQPHPMSPEEGAVWSKAPRCGALEELESILAGVNP